MIKLNECPCCGSKTIAEVGEYEICDICDWEDDPMQRENPDDALGANTMSLNKYRAEWKKKSARASVSA